MENRGTNQENFPTGSIRAVTRLNDIGFRLILIPLFGILIPIVTGMINHANFTDWEVKFSFLYTIAISFVIWHGNRYLLFTLRSYFDWFNKPMRKMAVLLLSVTFFTIPVSILLLVGWYRIFGNGITDWDVILESTLIIMISVVFIVHVYETVFLVKESENEMLKNEQLQRARAEAELEALKNQVDPHFIFNSLNTLSYLIESKPERAKRFNDSLAEVYRYILQNKSRDLVLLGEEIRFLKQYFSLLKIRFESAVHLEINMAPVFFDQYLILPISLQVLVENAIKHNELSDSVPLTVVIEHQEDTLVVHNPVRRKKLRKRSSGIGLENLKERYRLVTERAVGISSNAGQFRVSLPLIKIG